MLHVASTVRVRVADSTNPSGYGYAFTWSCLCGGLGRHTWESDRWPTRPERLRGPGPGNIRYTRSALQAAADHERNGRTPNRGKGWA